MRRNLALGRGGETDVLSAMSAGESSRTLPNIASLEMAFCVAVSANAYCANSQGQLSNERRAAMREVIPDDDGTDMVYVWEYTTKCTGCGAGKQRGLVYSIESQFYVDCETCGRVDVLSQTFTPRRVPREWWNEHQLPRKAGGDA